MMVQNIVERWWQANQMARALRDSRMEIPLKVNMSRESDRASESISFLMERNMKASGSKTSSTARVSIILPIIIAMTDCGFVTISRDAVRCITTTATSMK